MSSLQRISAVLKKDIHWAQTNMKLLTIMILPAFIVILFSRLDGEATFGFSLTFVNAFVGLFAMSYLIIEEKNKGTLLALLTSPLRNHELLISKYLFTLLLCVGFSVLAAVVNGRLDILVKPVILLNLLLFAGTACFYGYVTGLFFKNEQEMSIFAPLLMFMFVIGETINRASDVGGLHAFFPDYHFSKLISDSSPNDFGALVLHTGFNSVFFVAALLFAVFFTRFYFANNREKRFSMPLFLGLLMALSFFGVSGVLSPKVLKAKNSVVNSEGMSALEFSSPLWSGKLYYDPTKTKVRTLIATKNRKIYEIKKLNETSEIMFGLRTADDAEKTLETRSQKLKTDEKRAIVGEVEVGVDDYKFKKWSFFAEKKMVLLVEGFCKDQLLQASLEIKNPDTRRMTRAGKDLQSFLKRLKPKCSKTESGSPEKPS